MNEKFEIGGKARIPDEDMRGWIESLAGSELSEKEIDAMLSRLNDTYAEAKGFRDAYLEEELAKIEKATMARRGYGLTAEEEKYFREAIKSREES